MRIDRFAAEDEIAGAHDIDVQRIGDTLRNMHRTSANDADMHRPLTLVAEKSPEPAISRCSPPLIPPISVEPEPAMSACTSDAEPALILPEPATLHMQVARDIGDHDLAGARHAQMRFLRTANRCVRVDRFEMHIAERIADGGIADHVADIDIGALRHDDMNIEILGAVVHFVKVEPVLPVPDRIVVAPRDDELAAIGAGRSPRSRGS